MLYLISFAAFFVWMVILLRKKQLSWHAIIASYSIAVFSADVLEVTFNLLLNLYKFPTHLSKDPVMENEIGIIFADTLILPITLIIFVYYARNRRPWRISLIFASLMIFKEWIYVILGYMEYIHWNLAISAAFYVIGFRVGAFLAPRIATYHPPVPYWIFLLSFSHTVIMWFGAIFASPVLQMYQFKPGIFEDVMADCRFIDLLSGDILAILCVLLLLRIPQRFKPPVLAAVASLGIGFSLYAYHREWLVYYNWNHFFMVLRYLVPCGIIWLYDRWELAYRAAKTTEIA
ncbi:hypothetical protein SAMN05421736_108114 [Evansella caseinilytica]|uniref:Uncharacterized protein n=1 Tax=Evansella caseinilytica TaxID=1503961 RepID=A0A1H3RHV3_9BACI|nr:hypothetical protein [Evansella caseinilytica]SDZ25314.1 hypothetical protein SAMN05421736_108114 [Evansella caseinilytica]